MRGAVAGGSGLKPLGSGLSAGGRSSHLERSRASLCARLDARRTEIEQTFITRAYAISDPAEVADPQYLDGLRTAVSAALDYGLGAIENRGGRLPPLPPALLVQARLAARNGVSLDTVLRRYFAGYSLLGDFLIEEAERQGLGAAELKRLLRVQASVFDPLLAAVSEEYAREQGERPRLAFTQRLNASVERLLAGEMVDTTDLAYSFDGWHLAVLIAGAGAEEAIRDLAGAIDCQALVVPRAEQIVWAWLGARSKLDPAGVEGIASTWPPGLVLAIGEPAESIAGWRLSHRQAAAALPIARRGGTPIVRYADVALLASILQDDLLAASLRQLYLTPLEHEREGGEVARMTLRAYFTAARNTSSAAVALGVNRNTVASRLRAIEERLGRPIDSCAHEIEVALRLEEIQPVVPRAVR